MRPLNLPPLSLRLHRTTRGQEQIFDPLRRKYVRLTPEEWVRQHFTNYLIHHMGYPAALLANEVGIEVNGVTRRCDSVLYHRTGGRPHMIIEYKAPTVPITQAVFQQIYAYNFALHADYLIVSNGLQHCCCKIDYTTLSTLFLPDIPPYSAL